MCAISFAHFSETPVRRRASQVSKYGKVDSVRVQVVGNAVKVFVTCATEADVANAIKNLHRRYFGGRIISAHSIPMP